MQERRGRQILIPVCVVCVRVPVSMVSPTFQPWIAHRQGLEDPTQLLHLNQGCGKERPSAGEVVQFFKL